MFFDWICSGFAPPPAIPWRRRREPDVVRERGDPHAVPSMVRVVLMALLRQRVATITAVIPERDQRERIRNLEIPGSR